MPKNYRTNLSFVPSKRKYYIRSTELRLANAFNSTKSFPNTPPRKLFATLNSLTAVATPTKKAPASSTSSNYSTSTTGEISVGIDEALTKMIEE
jgi:hypothetical protein